MSRVDLRGANLTNADLSNVDLSHADLSDALVINAYAPESRPMEFAMSGPTSQAAT